MQNKNPNYNEFSDPRLVEIYDTINPIVSYEGFYIELAAKLGISSIIDFGCGSGLLSCALAKKGYPVIGIEPSDRMLALAKKRSNDEQIQWIEGDTEQLANVSADLVIMTGHVAQFFLEDKAWQATLKASHKALNSNGYIAFESRNPLVPPFNTWPSDKSHQKINDPKAGQVEWWAKLLETTGDRVRYEIHYLFTKSGEELVSINALRFRTQTEISNSLRNAGFSIKNIYGDWDGSPTSEKTPEMIFVAKREP